MLPVFWWNIDLAVKTTITQRIQTEVRGIHFFYKSGMLFIKLPSGRLLSYVKPRIGENQYGGESVTYEGVGSTKKWERIESYGPKFVENIVQAVSRDILCYAMKTLRHCFIVGHRHIFRPSQITQMGMFRPYAGIIKTSGNRIDRRNLPILVLAEI